MHLTREQAEQVLDLAKSYQAQAPTTDPLDVDSQVLQDVLDQARASFLELRDEIQRGAPARGELPARAREINRRLKEVTIQLHQGTRDKNETYLSRLEEVLSAEQLTVVNSFKPCLIPPKDLNAPIRAGQAADNTGIVKRMRKIRSMPEQQWQRDRERLVDDYLDRIDHHKFRMTPAEREAERIRLLALLEEVREMPETSFELSKAELAAQVEPQDRMDALRREIDYRHPHRQQRPPKKPKPVKYLLSAVIIPILEERLDPDPQRGIY